MSHFPSYTIIIILISFCLMLAHLVSYATWSFTRHKREHGVSRPRDADNTQVTLVAQDFHRV